MSSHVRCLLSEVYKIPKFREAYRLDILHDQAGSKAKVKVTVTVSPTAWFETMQRHYPLEIIGAAHEWVETTRSNISEAEHGPSFGEKVYVAGEADYVNHCQDFENYGGSEQAHFTGTRRACSSPVDHLSDPYATCKSYVLDGLRVEWLASDPDYYLLQSPKARRELILIPKLGYEPQAERHVTNEDLVDSKAARRVILKMALTLSARIEVNFGVWERLQHDNLALQSCDGHVHFYLTASSWEKLFVNKPQNAAEIALQRKMIAIQLPAPDRRVQDCDELERRLEKAASIRDKILRVVQS